MSAWWWKLRYTYRMWERGIDWRTGWYCAGVAVAEYGMEDAPRDAADNELSCWD